MLGSLPSNDIDVLNLVFAITH
ncbi:hypothetical protein H1P_2020015 [Hyella patelloides LEGE 07179]|uniref:Uncharacterized protein n=1 Tax=Hyella patelloides LEGE 07179 TaxID=945734 RepID=A0A563VQ77_9CYAN|nr:hypothetical protein H1P_2020015 [Hyella patelloides LEGE 07179]